MTDEQMTLTVMAARSKRMSQYLMDLLDASYNMAKVYHEKNFEGCSLEEKLLWKAYNDMSKRGIHDKIGDHLKLIDTMNEKFVEHTREIENLKFKISVNECKIEVYDDLIKFIEKHNLIDPYY